MDGFGRIVTVDLRSTEGDEILKAGAGISVCF